MYVYVYACVYMAGHMEESTAAIWKPKVSASLPQLRGQLVVTVHAVPRSPRTYSCVLLCSIIPACRTGRTKAIRVRFAWTAVLICTQKRLQAQNTGCSSKPNSRRNIVRLQSHIIRLERCMLWLLCVVVMHANAQHYT